MRAGSLIVLAACSYDPRTAQVVGPDGPIDLDAPPAEVWLAGWSHRKPITLQASAIVAPVDGLVDFPVLISIDDPEVAAIALADGADLAFTTADGITMIPREVEAYDAGRLVAWVKVPVLLDADTRLYLYYGNPQPFDGRPKLVWDASFLGVYHLQQNPGPGTANEMRDATTNDRHGTASSEFADQDSVAGQIGRGVHMNSSNQFITVGTTNVGDAFTISAWMAVSTDSSIQTLLANSANGNNTDGWRFFVNTSGQNDYVLRFETSNGMGSGDTAITPEDVVVPNAWHHVAAVVDKLAGSAQIFVDGELKNPTDTSISALFESNSDFSIGRMENDTNEYGGIMDEVELSSVMRPIEWLQTSHANQRTPSAFYAIGAQELER